MSVDNPTVSTANSAEEQAYREASGQETVDAGTADPGKPTTLFNIVFVTSEVHSPITCRPPASSMHPSISHLVAQLCPPVFPDFSPR